MEDYGLNSHKLMYHPKLVSNWLDGKKTYPIYIEISLTNRCNHKCLYCAVNFSRTKLSSLDTDVVKTTLSDISRIGVKAIMLGGEGEPLMHKDCVEIIKYAKNVGLEVSLTTNGVLIDTNDVPELTRCLSWIKFSLDSGNPKVYSKLHGTREMDMKIALDNLSKISFYKRLHKLNCVVGGQAILFKDNYDSIVNLAKVLRALKADYFVIKPFSEHEKRIGPPLETPSNEDILKLKSELEKFETDTFKVIIRETAFENLNKPKKYDKCYAQDFIGHINSFGNVYSCVNYIDNNAFKYGNINEKSFKEIWDNKTFVEPNLSECRSVCRLDNINLYLWDLKNDSVIHKNFI